MRGMVIWSIKNSGEILNKSKSKNFLESSFSTYEGRSLKIYPDLLSMVGEKPILAQLFVFLYIGFCKGDIFLPSFDAVMWTSTLELNRLCMKPCIDFENEALIV